MSKIILQAVFLHHSTATMLCSVSILQQVEVSCKFSNRMSCSKFNHLIKANLNQMNTGRPSNGHQTLASHLFLPCRRAFPFALEYLSILATNHLERKTPNWGNSKRLEPKPSTKGVFTTTILQHSTHHYSTPPGR